ncbi:hypothetical protein ACU4GD_22355 [Cupriavidus basilensis]
MTRSTWKIAEDRLGGALPDLVNEADLMRQYKTARSALRNVLSRIQEEGWVERRIGHGWCFLPMIDSAQAYEESYLYRSALETDRPSGAPGSRRIRPNWPGCAGSRGRLPKAASSP